MPIAKSSGNNMKRIDAVKRAIGYIQTSIGGITIRELADMMTLSESTIKGYLWALLESKIVSRGTDKKESKHPVSRYRVIANADQINDFIDSLKYDLSRTRQPRPKAPRSQEQRMAKDPSRHFHVANDDEPVRVRISRLRVPAQWDVLAVFFGMAPA